ncbi:hypothetical protein Mapa_001990 [Marchantia paleacea]|nr:hypothetical protein Mapa_001990 [Marchantia paleacea]
MIDVAAPFELSFSYSLSSIHCHKPTMKFRSYGKLKTNQLPHDVLMCSLAIRKNPKQRTHPEKC